MTTTRKLILCACVMAFAATLAFVPVTMTVAGHSYDVSRVLLDFSQHDRVRFDVLALRWAGIAVLGTVAWLMAGGRR